MSLLDADADQHAHNLLAPGRPVEVWVQLDRSWADGYEIEDMTADGYLIRRISDGTVLGTPIPVGSVRAITA